ncbi:hypothetical protein RRG08_027977 [Elysia crispata]|uniref:Uncharacterized protein n=1 Tax=Elysia crispata TaxID=231223 RepID=A0AAE1EDT4_9GAST|nr:hypothetical protein RRG08_027977 [Elysia crispata]
MNEITKRRMRRNLMERRAKYDGSWHDGGSNERTKPQAAGETRKPTFMYLNHHKQGAPTHREVVLEKTTLGFGALLKSSTVSSLVTGASHGRGFGVCRFRSSTVSSLVTGASHGRGFGVCRFRSSTVSNLVTGASHGRGFGVCYLFPT